MSWDKFALEKIADVSSGQGAPQGDDKFSKTGIPFVRAGSMEHLVNGGSLSELELVQDDVAKEYSLKLHPKNTILFAKSGMSAKKDRVYCLPEPSYVVNHLATIIPDEKEVDPSFLSYYFKVFKPSSLIRDTSYPSIRITDIRNVEIPLPPIKTQKKIAAVLEKADALRQKRRQTIEKLDDLTQSVFLDMFGDPYHNQKDFPLGTIRDIVSATKYGTNKKAHEEKGEFPVIRMGNLTYSGEWDFTDMKYVDLEDNELEKYLVYKGDVLFNRTNSKELVGKTGVYRREKPIAYAGYLIRIRTNEKANSEFLAGFLNSPYAKKKLEHMCKNIVGMANINAQELQDIEIIIPPIELQEKFKKKTSKIREQRKKLEKSLKSMNLLFNSLLQKAFKGELNFRDSENKLLAEEEQEYLA